MTIQCWWSRQGFDRVSVDHAASKVDVRALHPRIHYVCGRHTGGAWHQSPGTVYQSLSAAGGASSKGGPSHRRARPCPSGRRRRSGRLSCRLPSVRAAKA